MVKEGIVYCIDESGYSNHITKRKSYTIVAIKEDQIRIKNDNQKHVWLSNLYFVDFKPPNIVSIVIDDEIRDSKNDCIEVTITMSDGERRWTTFMTIEWLKNLFNEYRNYFTGQKIIFVEEVTKDIIEQTIIELDKQNELIEMTHEY
jgi:hypothetical protein